MKFGIDGFLLIRVINLQVLLRSEHYKYPRGVET